MMKISNSYEISDNYKITHANGYWNYHEMRVSKSGKNKGKLVSVRMKTYPNLLDMYQSLKDLGECGNKIMEVSEKLIIEVQKQAGREIMAKRKREALKKGFEL